ncbi:28S ribosomal protein S5, mitochondrial [Pangasianodon hypophthalmus]|uniref:28S ribosomal protein S5, mitochondrial n=1 Tax=Pangasianodon hypophthalmus TaxID=310915 RepID=UPI0023083583|nr:28S ribosomal protein S5, mitochondrial [Pangasianodon hypophthalmus]
MAAATRLCCVLRVSLGGARTLGGSGLFSSVARPSGSWICPAAAVPASPAAWSQTRHSSFFNKLTADELWRGVLAESGAGSRKGRGKRTKRKMKKDLNRGQNIGEGRGGFLWPGLNVPVIKGGTIQSFSKRGEVEQQELRAELERQRDEWDRKRKMKIKRERGWSGNCWGGISLGHPDPGPNGETYEDFDCRVIEVKSVFNMTAKEGRKRSISALVAVGNSNGAAGFALGKATDRTTALRKAKNRAMHYLYYIERYNDHTIYHDVESTFKRTTLRMKKQNKGYGLHCHRAVITLCKLIGIKDMYAKVEGSVNLLNITRALFQGLANQETHQSLADRKQLNVVEFSEERGPLPVVVARPQLGARSDPEVEDDVPNTKLHWADVQLAQGMKRSVWAGVKRTIW